MTRRKAMKIRRRATWRDVSIDLTSALIGHHPDGNESRVPVFNQQQSAEPISEGTIAWPSPLLESEIISIEWTRHNYTDLKEIIVKSENWGDQPIDYVDTYNIHYWWMSPTRVKQVSDV